MKPIALFGSFPSFPTGDSLERSIAMDTASNFFHLSSASYHSFSSTIVEADSSTVSHGAKSDSVVRFKKRGFVEEWCIGEMKNGNEGCGHFRGRGLGADGCDLKGTSNELRDEERPGRREPESLPDLTRPGSGPRAEFERTRDLVPVLGECVCLVPEEKREDGGEDVREIVRVLTDSVEGTEDRDDEADGAGRLRSGFEAVDGFDEMGVVEGVLEIVRFCSLFPMMNDCLAVPSALLFFGNGTSGFSSTASTGVGGNLSTTKHLANLLFPWSIKAFCSSIEPCKGDPRLPVWPCSRASPARVGARGRVVRILDVGTKGEMVEFDVDRSRLRV